MEEQIIKLNKKYSERKNNNVEIELVTINCCLDHMLCVNLNISFKHEKIIKTIYNFRTHIKKDEFNTYINEIDKFIIIYSPLFLKKVNYYTKHNVIIEENEQDTFLKIKTISNLDSNDIDKLDKSQNLSQALNIAVKLFKA